MIPETPPKYQTIKWSDSDQYQQHPICAADPSSACLRVSRHPGPPSEDPPRPTDPGRPQRAPVRRSYSTVPAGLLYHLCPSRLWPSIGVPPGWLGPCLQWQWRSRRGQGHGSRLTASQGTWDDVRSHVSLTMRVEAGSEQVQDAAGRPRDSEECLGEYRIISRPRQQ